MRHIKNYCEDIAETIERFGEDYETFEVDKDFYKSVSMSMMQIGELSVTISDEFRKETADQVQWGAIKGMRNLFAHAYAKLSKKVIWASAISDIPVLLSFCEQALEQSQEIFQSDGPSLTM